MDLSTGLPVALVEHCDLCLEQTNVIQTERRGKPGDCIRQKLGTGGVFLRVN